VAAVAGFVGDGGGAPGDVGEGRGVGELEADEVVAAIVAGPRRCGRRAGEEVDSLLEGGGGTVGESESMRQTEA